MNVLKKLIISIAILFVILIVVGLFLPSSFHVQRSITVDAPVSTVYQNVVDLKKWKTWGVWFKRDPNMVVTYSGPDRAVGMSSSWISESEGNGVMTITELEHDKSITYSLHFPDYDMGSTGHITLEKTSSGTRVVWEDYGDLGGNIINRYFGMMMDSLIGPDFENGLANLKMISENQVN